MAGWKRPCPFDRNKEYVVTGLLLEMLEDLKNRLYDWDYEKWPLGEHRDWANKVLAHLDQNVICPATLIGYDEIPKE